MLTRSLPTADYATALRLWARGTYAVEAATELLIRHQVWPARTDFRRAAVQIIDNSYDGITLAALDFHAAHEALSRGRLCCSTSEAAMLRLACSLAAGAPTDLGSTITSIDTTNRALLIAAIHHAGGDRTAWERIPGARS